MRSPVSLVASEVSRTGVDVNAKCHAESRRASPCGPARYKTRVLAALVITHPDRAYPHAVVGPPALSPPFAAWTGFTPATVPMPATAVALAARMVTVHLHDAAVRAKRVRRGTWRRCACNRRRSGEQGSGDSHFDKSEHSELPV